jgi:hypothetical protein
MQKKVTEVGLRTLGPTDEVLRVKTLAVVALISRRPAAWVGRLGTVSKYPAMIGASMTCASAGTETLNVTRCLGSDRRFSKWQAPSTLGPLRSRRYGQRERGHCP